ncbi:MAG: hypothetical protein H6650_10105 [Ardenticatenales bacterium]|nr:hypothetical protein [Ardenticatenales bacterium]
MTSIFPVLSSLTELLTGSVTDDFKKLIKPGPLVAAAIFLALNQVLVLPALRQHRIVVILAFESLSTTWQVLLGTFILFVSGYLLNASGTTFVNLISGQIIRDTWLGDKGVARQRQILEGLLAKLRAYADDETGDEAVRTAAARATQRLATDFPEPMALAPTQLGNILANPASYTWNQYGVHLDTMWPAMEAVLRAENDPLRQGIAGRMDALIFLASLAGVSGLVAGEILLLRLWWGPLWHLLWLPVLGLFAYTAYATAIPQARAWARDMRLAFDLHLDAVAAKLKLRPLATYEHLTATLEEGTGQMQSPRMGRWEAVSRWLLYGALRLPQENWTNRLAMPRREPDWYYEPPQPASPLSDVSLLYPPTVSVTLEQQRLPAWELRNRRVALLAACRVAYLFGITNESAGDHAAPARNVFLLVGDKRAPVLPASIVGRLNQADVLHGLRQPGPPDKVLWGLGDIAPRTTVWLRYEVDYDPRLKIMVENATLLEVKPVGVDAVKLFLQTDGPRDVTVMVTRLTKMQVMPAKIHLVVAHSDKVLTPVPVTVVDESSVAWRIEGVPQDKIIQCVLRPAQVRDEES